MRAPIPEHDIRDLKTLMRADKLKREGVAVVTPGDLLKYLPAVEPLAMGTVFEPYRLGEAFWEGHWVLKEPLTWGNLPEFSWCDLYAQVAVGAQ